MTIAAQDRPRLAYAVLEKDDMTGGIVFAQRDIEARKWGANEFSDGEISNVQCRRAPWADAYAGKGGVPASLAIAHGWNFECHGCGETIDTDWLDERGLPVGGVCGTMNGLVFCSPRCKWRDMKYEAARKAAAAEALACFKGIIRSRFGDVTFVDGKDFTGHGHAISVVRGDRGGWHWSRVSVAFEFPGMKYGPACLTRREPPQRGSRGFIGPVKPEYTCASGDREAFEAFAAATRQSGGRT